MKTSLESISNLEKKLSIEVPPQLVNDEFNKAYQYLQKKVDIKGYRKGKAPMTTIRTIYADKVKSDVVQNIVQTTYFSALKEHNLTPISMPSIDFQDIKEDAPFTFTANFEIRPDIQVKTKSGFKVQKEKLTIDDKRVNDAIDNMRQNHASFESITEDRPLAEGDFAIIDFEGIVNGAPLENGSAKGHQLEIGSKQFIPGFEEALIGAKKGDQREVSIKFPDDYHVENLKGAPVTFKTTLQDIKRKVLPEVNEEFSKKLGNDSLEQLKTKVREEMENSEKKRIETEMRDTLMKTFVEANPVEVPKSLFEEQRKALVADFQSRLKSQGFNDDNFNEYQDKWNEDFDKTATFMVQSAFLIDKISEDEKLRATDADVDAKFTEMAKQWGMDKDRIMSFYKEKQGGLDQMKYQITEDKVFEYLLKNSSVEEIEKPQNKE
jgi:trigger factor